ncbi:MAG: arsenic metallochaperone ArsD family protein [Pirellula sp.]|nr:arsenic metallochaperone ArsD family protein [Pirellula sp.]
MSVVPKSIQYCHSSQQISTGSRAKATTWSDSIWHNNRKHSSKNKSIHQVLSTEGTDSLPVVVVNGEIVSRKVYPNRDMLIALVHGVAAKQLLPVASANGGCCGTSGCC